MKNFFASICFFIVLLTTKQASAQTCTPQAATGQPGVNPPTQNLGCIERGQPYSDVIYIENFDQFNTALGVATLNYLRIDSITNLPCDLQWKSNKQDNTYLAAETGCISLFGTSNDNVGQYRVKIYITVEVVVPGFPQPLVLADEAEALVNQVEALSGTPTGINFKYFLRVIELGEPCPALDTTANATNNVACSVIVNPVLGVNVTATDDTICVGETTQLTAVGSNGTPPYSYKWLANPTLSDTTIANPIASPIETTDYTAIVTDANGDQSFFTKTIVVKALPVNSFTHQTPGSSFPVCCSQNLIVNTSTNIDSSNMILYTYNFSPADSINTFNDSISYFNQLCPVKTNEITAFPYILKIISYNECGSVETLDTLEVDCGSSVKDKIFENKISLFPNPTNQLVSIYTDDALLNNELHIQLYNAASQLLLEEKYSADVHNHNAKTLYLLNFSKGIYFVKVISKQGVALKKLIIE